MFTDQIDDLEQRGFTITKTRDVQTILEHSNPFTVKGSERDIPAPFNDTTNKFTVTFSGYPVSNTLQENVRQHTLPLFNSINELINKLPNEDESTNEASQPNLVETTFGQLDINSEFMRSNDFTKHRPYIKIDNTSCKRNDDSIGSVLETVLSNDEIVYIQPLVEMDYSALSPDQKRSIVHAAQEGLSESEFNEYAANELEDVAGVETLEEDAYADLIEELYQMYSTTK